MKKIFALLIGINEYPSNKLKGCINDVLDVKSFFDELQQCNPDSIAPVEYRLLVAPNEEDEEALADAGITPSDYDPPTRHNIIMGFNLFKNATEEDICLLYYSGHGSIQRAPKPFWHMKSGKQLETLVCQDSRTACGRDLLDKELAYLIWNSTRKHNPHFLCIMDCCHAGHNSRSENDHTKDRQDHPNRNRSALNDWLGYNPNSSFDPDNPDDFYFETPGREGCLDTRIGNHVNFGASMENQSAKELRVNGKRRGIFTHTLMTLLRNGGTTLSYEQLKERVGPRIKDFVKNQNPSLYAKVEKDKKGYFLGQEKGMEVPSSYGIYLSSRKGHLEWRMTAGQIHGVRMGTAQKPTLVRVLDGSGNSWEVKVKAVKDTYSILDMAALTVSDGEKLLRAFIIHMPNPRIAVVPHQTLPEDMSQALMKYYRANENDYPHINITDGMADYEIRNIGDAYILTEPGTPTPLFQRQTERAGFLKGLETIGKYRAVLGMGEDNNSRIKREDLDVEVAVYEGQGIHPGKEHELQAGAILSNPGEVQVKYVETGDEHHPMMQPAITIRIKSPNKRLSVKAFWMDSEFGIMPLHTESDTLSPEGGAEALLVDFGSFKWSVLPISKDERYSQMGVYYFKDYLKIFVTPEPVTLDYEQKGLPIDSAFGGADKSIGFDYPLHYDEWMAFHIPVHIHRPAPSAEREREINAGQPELSAGVTLEVPEGFSCTASLASEAQVRQKLTGLEESARFMAESEARQLNASLLPPSDIWRGVPTSEEVVATRGGSASADAQISILEMQASEESRVMVSPDNPLTMSTRAVLNEGESIVAYAYDEESGLYLPCGNTDGEGNIQINYLPAPTRGRIFEDKAINTKSVGRSIKLFLKKIIWTAHDLNELRQVTLVDGDLVSKRITDNALSDARFNHIALLVHGIIGDTKSIAEGVFLQTDIHQRFDAVLTYDYENLSTDLDKTAEVLRDKLKDAGLFAQGKPRLTIIAHSMGGLVSRQFIKAHEGAKVVEKLILVGTPNGGSEISDVRKSLTTMLAWGMNGIPKLRPIMPFLSYVGNQVGKRVFHTLNQMSPSSEFLKKLNARALPASVAHYVVAGNTGKIEVDDEHLDTFMKKLLEAAKTRGKYVLLDKLVFKKENDMAVTIESMGTVPGFDKNALEQVACDHISYFTNEKALEMVEAFLDK